MYYSIMCSSPDRGVFSVIMDDLQPEETIEQQDSSKERSLQSPGGDICEYCWPEVS